ncbi:hypothetical protein [Falsibacillus albus]|uniref:Cytosolic protein n=1 Tax=Falsibacillus albus TaxID=2478915 RepID=A0A3L7K4M0_9BACI|nr:hypothetical protein [Falsibacillus albus]RLQ97978.1 hypothetical protein D9X91_00885 [Falsibacillus albus]
MSFFRTLFQRFQHQCETSEKHSDPSLATHYYRTSFDKAFEAVGEIFSDSMYKPISHSKEHGEWAFQKKGIFIIASIVTVRPFETAIDFKITSDDTKISGPYPKLRKEIISYYNWLDGNLPVLNRK